MGWGVEVAWQGCTAWGIGCLVWVAIIQVRITMKSTASF